MAPCVDPQHFAMGVCAVAVQSKCLTPRRPVHFSSAYRKVAGLSVCRAFSWHKDLWHLSHEQRQIHHNARILWEAEIPLLDLHPITHRQPEDCNLHDLLICLFWVTGTSLFLRQLSLPARGSRTQSWPQQHTLLSRCNQFKPPELRFSMTVSYAVCGDVNQIIHVLPSSLGISSALLEQALVCNLPWSMFSNM